MKPPYAIGSVPSLSGHAVAYRWRSLPRVRRHRASKPQGSSERVLPWQITMDQLIFASLSHTHYWYEVGMLKVPRCTLRWVPWSPMTSHPSRSYALKPSRVRPTPGVPSTAIVRTFTLCVATLISRRPTCARFLASLCRTRHSSSLPRRLRRRAKNSLIFV